MPDTAISEQNRSPYGPGYWSGPCPGYGPVGPGFGPGPCPPVGPGFGPGPCPGPCPGCGYTPVQKGAQHLQFGFPRRNFPVLFLIILLLLLFPFFCGGSFFGF